jgi:predicted ATPase
MEKNTPMPSARVSLVLALVHTAMIYQHRREVEPAQEQAEAAVAVCVEHGIAPHMAAAGSILRGWAIAARGQAVEGIAEIHRGLAAIQPTGMRIRRPYYLALLAEASAWAGEIEQALAALVEAARVAEETGERRWEAEICRLTGELTLARRGGDRTEAEGCFQRALDVAGCQSAKCLELRAAAWPGSGATAAIAENPAISSRRSTAGSPRASTRWI